MNDGIKYDDASWHYGGDFPADLPPEAAGTHIGMFVCWALLSGFAGEIHTNDFPEMLAKLRDRIQTPGTWFLDACDEKFVDEDLTEEGNAFALYYYGDPITAEGKPSPYLSDYVDSFAEYDELYAIPDTWESFDRLKPILDKRLAEWRSPKPAGWKKWFS